MIFLNPIHSKQMNLDLLIVDSQILLPFVMTLGYSRWGTRFKVWNVHVRTHYAWVWSAWIGSEMKQKAERQNCPENLSTYKISCWNTGMRLLKGSTKQTGDKIASSVNTTHTIKMPRRKRSVWYYGIYVTSRLITKQLALSLSEIQNVWCGTPTGENKKVGERQTVIPHSLLVISSVSLKTHHSTEK